MASLARYAHVQPSEFGALTPARTRALDKGVQVLVEGEWELQMNLAQLIAGARLS
jgi:thiamine biosynthesis protein ThiC